MSNGPWDPTRDGETQALTGAPPLGEVSVSNVIGIEEGKTKRQRKAPAQGDAPDKPDKRAPAEVFSDIATMMRRSKSSAPPILANYQFPERFRTVSVDGGVRKQIVEECDEGVCRTVPMQRVVDCIVGYTSRTVLQVPGFRLDHTASEHCAKYWRAQTRPELEPPAPYLFKSEPGLCYRRIPFDLTPGETPMFDEFFSRMTNADAVRMWVGSLFRPASDRQQYVWLYGAGGDGKGALARTLIKTLASSALTLSSAPKSNNKHWAVPFVGKRLVVFTDFTDTKTLMTGDMRSLTGGDRLYVDPKGKDGYEFDPVCKLLFLSNNLPRMSSMRADLRRIIFAEMLKGADKLDPTYEHRLWHEVPAFLAACVALYDAACPGGGEVPLSEEALEVTRMLGSALDEEFEAFFAEHFNRMATGYVLPAALQAKLDLRWRYARDTKLAFVEWLSKTKGVRKGSVESDKKGYRGITAKEPWNEHR